MTKTPWYPHLTVATLIEDNGKFLLVEEMEFDFGELRRELEEADGGAWVLIENLDQ